ncbi:glycosyl hydrolase family 18 protein [Bacillus tuaregi]|uniref:glycosyl hydrolase family 18 protein n=1 Tax=Bacillus tuaregi TaxID=1816695 RepID=UPI0008F8CD8B|nr:glycoside hydrolase family 18 protein [Bacillus tuaregi]
MRIRKLQIAVMSMIVFCGGFFSGVLYSNHNSQLKAEDIKEAQRTPKKDNEKQERSTIPEQEQKSETEQSKVLMGYVQDFRDPNIVNYEDLTHIIFSFAHPAKDGSLLFNGDTAIGNLQTIVAQAHEQDTKVMLAIGGWYHIQGGESYDYFKEAISNPAARARLVTELEGIAAREQLDGIDIDFEHPRTAEDARNLAVFIHDLYGKLHSQDKELSIAVNAKVHSVAGTEIHNVIYEPAMFQDVDYVNIMAYDGQWDGGYNAANLAPYHHVENIVHYWSNLFDSHQIAKEKLILGVPFYAQPEDPNSKQISYAAIINQSSDNASQDTVVMNGTTYHYNGMETVRRKTKLALDNSFGGMMLWEAGHDSNSAQSLTAAISASLEEEQKYPLHANRETES